MPEAVLHQASSLTQWSGMVSPQVVLLASHGDSRSEAALQDQLVKAWRHLGYASVCVDATRVVPPLQQSRMQVLEQLTQDHEPHDVMLVYVPISWLVEDLADFVAAPLLAVGANSTSVLTAYQALKQLTLKGHHHPTLVPVLEALDASALHTAEKLSQSISECAQQFLGQRPHMVPPIGLSRGHDITSTPSEGMLSLALRLMEPTTHTAPFWSH
jgi:hypothetical protein